MRHKYILIIPGRPVGKQSAQVTRKGAFIPDKSRNFMASVGQYAADAGVEVLDYCRVDIHICLPVRLKVYKTKDDVELEPKVRPDEDNVRKTVKDGLEGIAYVNDKNVVWGECGYHFINHDLMPFTRVIITECHWTDYRRRGEKPHA